MAYKTLVIPDIHGEDFWIHESPFNYEKIVFLGDFWDSFDKSFEKQKEMFLRAMQWKKENPKNVHILRGNHDWQYEINKHIYSGWQPHVAFHINTLMLENQHLFENACLIDNILYTHAGLSKNFWKSISKAYDSKAMNEAEYLNLCNNHLLHTPYSQGDSTFDPISWIRPIALQYDLYTSKNVKRQIVGHTHSKTTRSYCDGKLLVIDNYTCFIIN